MDEQKKTDELTGSQDTNETAVPEQTDHAVEASIPAENQDKQPEDKPADIELTESNTEITEEDEEVEEYHPPVYQSKLTPTQSKVVQSIIGVAVGFLIWFSLAISVDAQDSLLSWLWVIIFAVVMVGKNYLQNKKGMDLRIFMKAFLISLIIFLVGFLIYGGVTGKFTQ